MFHVSYLKKFTGSLPQACDRPLPLLTLDNRPILTPLAIIRLRKVFQDQIWKVQLLVQWSNLEPEEATWEDLSVVQSLYPQLNLKDLEDRSILMARGIIPYHWRKKKSFQKLKNYWQKKQICQLKKKISKWLMIGEHILCVNLRYIKHAFLYLDRATLVYFVVFSVIMFIIVK
ncbi:Chromo domain-containing protein [Cephalotus follicularis]|uniref:Chromo domain-containing protein n=1 Tax=Cephalotus follicularis TaxID=3775 RepID=A0A1Q3CNY5_CEPFO|nr:Chromo domain-containing protein [Cephalotus follicularis]GAV81769.1 Chromo domain-containing protein [Cephalotus follicularis]